MAITDKKLNTIKKNLKECIDNRDLEMAHSDADTQLCELLIELGYKDIVELWYDVGKWYA